MTDVCRNAAAEMIRAAEETVRAAWCYWNEANAAEVDQAIGRMDMALAQLTQAVNLHRGAQEWGASHRIYVPVALDVQAIIGTWRGMAAGG